MKLSGYEIRVVGSKELVAGGIANPADAPIIAAAQIDGDASTVHRFRFPAVTANTVEADGQTYLRLGLAEYGKAIEAIGMPEIPVSRRILRVPQGKKLNCIPKVLGNTSFSLRSEGLPETLFPEQRPVVKQPSALEKASLCRSAEQGGASSAKVSPAAGLLELGIQGEEQVYLLEVRPLAYDVTKGELSLRQEIDVEISINDDVSLPISGQATKGGASGKRLLIIAPDGFLPALAAFATHKRSLGWEVDLVGTGLAGTTAAQILAHIRARYLVTDYRPSHLLLVGDSNSIPTWTGKGAYTADTDLYYACMDGENDWLPDLFYGRWPAGTEVELQSMITRSIHYETSISANSPYIKRAAFAASTDNRTITEGSHETVIARHMTPRAAACDRLYSYTYGATGAQVLSAVNGGRGMVTYSGHGYTDRWRDPLVRVSDVAALANTGMPPLVLSFACDTGAFADSNPCLGEAWLKTSANTGAVAFIGSSEDTYWEEDDVFQKAVFDALFTDGVQLAGDLLTAAKMRYLAVYGPGAETLQYFEQYHLLGDPTLSLASPVGTSVTDAAFAVRKLSTHCVTTGQAVTVALEVEVGASPPSAIIIKEKLPSGWTVSNATWNGVPMVPTYATGEYKWLFGLNTPVADGILQYETKAIGTVDQTFLISGSVLYGSNTVYTTGGQEIRICETIDSDGDGIPDAWEQLYGLSSAEKSDALEDWDGDGFTNGQEYACDTNPLERSSVLSITQSSMTSEGFQLGWKGGTESTQFIERSEDPTNPDGWSVVWVRSPPTSNAGVFLDSDAIGVMKHFYRVRASR